MDYTCLMGGTRIGSFFSLSFDVVKIVIVTSILSLYYAIKSYLPTSCFTKKSIVNQIVLITGGGHGLGRMLAVKMAGLGARIVIWDINEKWTGETVNLIKNANQNALIKFYTCDLCNKDEVYRTAETVQREVGDVDILINNAGIVTGKNLLECPDEMIIKNIDVNCLAHFWTVKAFLPQMASRNYGHIVTISSIAGIIGLNGMVDYSCSKYGAVGFHESLGIELQALGLTSIQTTLVCSYFINTGMFDGVTSKFNWALPIMDLDYASEKILTGILLNRKMILVPRFLQLFVFLKGLLPVEVMYYLGNAMEATKSMKDFKGHAERA